MPPNTVLNYVDSCVFLSFINGEEEEGRLPSIKELFEKAQRGDITLITSVVTQVEVAFAKEEQDNRVLDPAVVETIDALWRPGGPVKLVEFHQLIAESARDLIRLGQEMEPNQWRLKPLDATHLATASRHKAKHFYTYSKDLPRYADALGMKIIRPPEATPTLFSGGGEAKSERPASGTTEAD